MPFEGAASAFRSAPVPRKAAEPVASEFGCPQYALPGGGPFWAQGWHAGQVGWFKCQTVALRKAWPRIHVRWLSDADGRTHPLALPELSSYVHAGQIRPRDW